MLDEERWTWDRVIGGERQVHQNFEGGNTHT